MPGNSPETYSLITYLWVIGVSLWAGLAQYIHKIKTGIIDRFSIAELVGELFISAFVGVLTFWLCEAAGFSQVATAAMVGITAYMGDKAFLLGEKWLEKMVTDYFCKS